MKTISSFLIAIFLMITSVKAEKLTEIDTIVSVSDSVITQTKIITIKDSAKVINDLPLEIKSVIYKDLLKWKIPLHLRGLITPTNISNLNSNNFTEITTTVFENPFGNGKSTKYLLSIQESKISLETTTEEYPIISLLKKMIVDSNVWIAIIVINISMLVVSLAVKFSKILPPLTFIIWMLFLIQFHSLWNSMLEFEHIIYPLGFLFGVLLFSSLVLTISSLVLTIVVFLFKFIINKFSKKKIATT